MSFNTRHRSRKPLLLLLVPLVLFVGVVIAATLLTTTVPVSVTGGMTSVTMGPNSCPITGGTSASCSSVSLTVGTNEILTVKAQGTPNGPVTVQTSQSANPPVVSITPSSANPTTLDTNGLATFTFTITGSAVGFTVAA